MAEETIRSHAKINLSLDVTGKREDGYHTVETVMQKISLFDEVTVRWQPAARGEKQAPGGIRISLSSNKPFLPRDERNIAYKAALLMSENFAGQVGSGRVSIHLHKRIPVSAGLAGGSGNGAAVLTALNRLWHTGLSTRALCRLGSDLGADVPFCILTQNSQYGCALGSGTGADLTVIRSRFRRALVLVKPAFGVSTKEAYEGIDSRPAVIRPDTGALTEALRRGNRKQIYEQMVNVLENYTLAAYPQVQEIKDKLARETQAEKVLMTGSGPTVFAFYADTEKARAACALMRSAGLESYWARTL